MQVCCPGDHIYVFKMLVSCFISIISVNFVSLAASVLVLYILATGWIRLILARCLNLVTFCLCMTCLSHQICFRFHILFCFSWSLLDCFSQTPHLAYTVFIVDSLSGPKSDLGVLAYQLFSCLCFSREAVWQDNSLHMIERSFFLMCGQIMPSTLFMFSQFHSAKYF